MKARRPTARDISRALRAAANPAHAAILSRFFKTGPGDYGEGDRFLGLKVPVVRRVVRQFKDAAFDEATALLESPMHEERLAGLLLMVQHANRGGPVARRRIRELYLSRSQYINNWDLVDLSAPQIVGESLSPGRIGILRRLARSANTWERRIAVLATFAFVRRNDFGPTLELCEMLLQDDHDLIHKACGWMLREVGNRNSRVLETFLDQHSASMPRTMLRYSIERLGETRRKSYLAMRAARRQSHSSGTSQDAIQARSRRNGPVSGLS